MLLAIIADDLTGAGDAATYFATRGLETRVSLDGNSVASPVGAYSTDSRDTDAVTTQARIRKLSPAPPDPNSDPRPKRPGPPACNEAPSPDQPATPPSRRSSRPDRKTQPHRRPAPKCQRRSRPDPAGGNWREYRRAPQQPRAFQVQGWACLLRLYGT